MELEWLWKFIGSLSLPLVVLAIVLSLLEASLWFLTAGRRKHPPQQARDMRPMFRVTPGITWGIGVVVTVATSALSWWVLPAPFHIGVALAVPFYTMMGRTRIAIGSRGVPTRFGNRLAARFPREDSQDPTATIEIYWPYFELSEGWSWILPPPFMSAVPVDVRERSTSTGEFTVLSKNNVRITFRPSAIRFRIINATQSLSVERVDTALVELVQQVVRSQVRAGDDDAAVGAADVLRNLVRSSADRRAFDWGIDVREVLIGEIALPEAVQLDNERVRREARQQAAEEIELKHIRDRIEEFRDTGLAAEAVVELIQTEREKVKKNIQGLQVGFSPATSQMIRSLVEEVFGRRLTR